MVTYSEISFYRLSYEDGFGFACMKAAYNFGIEVEWTMARKPVSKFWLKATQIR